MGEHRVCIQHFLISLESLNSQTEASLEHSSVTGSCATSARHLYPLDVRALPTPATKKVIANTHIHMGTLTPKNTDRKIHSETHIQKHKEERKHT